MVRAGEDRAVAVCRSKKVYSSECMARMKGVRNSYNLGKTLWPYRCDVCGKWHLTKRDMRSAPITPSSSGIFGCQSV